MMNSLFTIDPELALPFNTWPKWAVLCELDLSDLVADLSTIEDDSSESKSAIEIIDSLRSQLKLYLRTKETRAESK